MFKNRFINLFIAVALVLIIALTVREALATASVTSPKETVMSCDSLPSRNSIHTETVSETGTRLTYTEDGPTGVDGGLISLLSAYRTCSR